MESKNGSAPHPPPREAELHPLLLRQLRRYPKIVDPENMPDLLRAVSEAYTASDLDRRLLERSLELTSTELLEKNAALREDVARVARAEAALRASEARSRAILDALPDLLFRVDADGRVSPGHESIPTSHPLIPLIGQHAAESLGKGTGAGVVKRSEIFVPDGMGERTYELRWIPLADAALVIARDVTDARQLERRLAVADRMSTLGTMAASIAHEINNPLTYVTSNLQFALEQLAGQADSSTQLTAALEQASDGCKQVSSIARNLKSFSRVEDRVRPVDVRELIDAALNMADLEIRNTARVCRDFRPIPLALANFRIAQVVLNLVVNAAHALSGSQRRDKEIVVRTRTADDGDVVIEVCDNGPGIPKEILPRIFEPFFTTKPEGIGTGLGLAICQSIVAELNGQLSVQSTPGRGTTFSAQIPKAPDSVPAPPPPQPAVAEQKEILLVDDEPNIVRAVRRLLSNHRLTSAGSAHEALRVLQATGTKFDLVLCDLTMPDMTGIELHAAVRCLDQGVASRFVFMTGVAFSDAALEVSKSLGLLVLEKPFDAAELRAVVAAAGA